MKPWKIVIMTVVVLLLTTNRDIAAKTVVVNEAFVKRYFPKQNPLGRRLGFGGPKAPLSREIVGVAADVR